ncbi:MAG: glycyl-radical enzyme activating protein [Pseudomonadota bacterium]
MQSEADKKVKGQVFNVQKYSVHDGPGIRTIVFLKGCPLSCRWCSNPESQATEPELAYNVGRCLTVAKCKRCLEVCTRGALIRQEDDTLKINRELCTGCHMPCAEACPSQGLIVYGSERTVNEVLTPVEQDMAFYTRSKGGMTLSGGEPLMQGEFPIALLREARARRIKTAIETCGVVPWHIMEEAAQYINYFLFDIKHMDAEKHKEYTGGSNVGILNNFKKLAAMIPDKTILCRTPIVPGFNDNVDDVRAICEFIKDMPNVQYEPLPYHRLGTQKYTFLDRIPPMGDVQLGNVMPAIIAVAQEVLGTDRVIVMK